jgi:hypothetical protein
MSRAKGFPSFSGLAAASAVLEPPVQDTPAVQAQEAAPPESGPGRISPELRRQWVSEAAYFRAERRGFRDGDPRTDWIEAEAEVDARIAALDGSPEA